MEGHDTRPTVLLVDRFIPEANLKPKYRVFLAFSDH